MVDFFPNFKDTIHFLILENVATEKEQSTFKTIMTLAQRFPQELANFKS